MTTLLVPVLQSRTSLALRRRAHRLTDGAADFDPLLERIIPQADDPDDAEVFAALDSALLQRAIGVIYRSRTERQSHYFRTRLARQFDAVLHYDVTRAVEPLERTPSWDQGEMPDTYPTAL